MSRYDDIINIKHFEPRFHPRMSLYSRSAQFAPFAALTGYGEAIGETARLTSSELTLTEDMKYIVDLKLQLLLNNLNDKDSIKITYFEKDKYKIGGKYLEYNGTVKRIDLVKRQIIFTDGNIINIDHIVDIKADFIPNNLII